MQIELLYSLFLLFVLYYCEIWYYKRYVS